jgi:hypothetical protein
VIVARQLKLKKTEAPAAQVKRISNQLHKQNPNQSNQNQIQIKIK